nr:hypothetical protein [Tanacetum cinerariifolium]
HGACLYTLEQLDIPHKVSKAINEVVTDAVDWAMQAPLQNRFRDLLEADIKEILQQRMWETDSYKSHEDHMQLYEALEKSMNRDHSEELAKDLAETCPAFEIVKVFHPNVIHLQYQMEECHKLLTDSVGDSILRHNVSKPLPLGGPPSQVTIQSDFFFNKDLEYLRYGSKRSRPALSISKMKVAYYPDVGLEQMVPDQIWIEEECKYDIAAIAVRTHMRILSVVRIEVFSMYGYDYMKKIVLRRADLNEHVIAERDFKAVKFQYRYGVQMIMRFNEIHKFIDGTLQQIDEALDYRVKEFRITRMNPGLNMRFWTRKDVDRSKEFMFAIQKWLKTRRIVRNLESFVGGRVRDGDYRLLKRTE